MAQSACQKDRLDVDLMATMRTRLLSTLFLLVLTSFARQGSAILAPSDSLADHYTRDTWRVQDGLPEDTVQAVLQDANAFLWVATTGGVARFDGSSFLPDAADGERLPTTSVFCLRNARDGSVWMGLEGGGLLRSRNGHLQSFGEHEGLTDQFVRALLEDSHHRLWVGTDEGLFVLSEGASRFRRVDGTERVSPLAVHAIAEDGAKQIWVGGSRLYSFLDSEVPTAKEYRLPGRDSQNRVKAILPARDGTLWVGTVQGLLKRSGSVFQTVPAETGTVRSLYEARDGRIWVGTIGHGLWLVTRGQLSEADRGTLLPSTSVLSISEDRNGQLWIGTQAGLVRLTRTPVQVLKLPHAADPDFETVSQDAAGELWVVASRVFHIADEIARPTGFPQFGDPAPRTVFRAPDGALWLGTDGEGLFRQRNGLVRHFHAPLDLPNNFIRAILQGRSGDTWVGTDDGLARITQKDHVEQLGMKQGLAFFSTRCLLEQRNGDIWVGTDGGLSIWRGEAFVHDAVTAAMRSEKVWSMTQSPDGTIWLGTRDDGLFRIRNAAVSHYTREQGLPTNSIYGVIERHGRLWLSGPDTLFSLVPAELDERGVHATRYALPASANEAQFYGGRQPSLAVDSSGRIWFPSSKGLLSIDPAGTDLTVTSPPPSVSLRGAFADGQPLRTANGSLELPADTHRLDLRFAPLLLTTQRDIRFRYQLLGFDEGWIDAGPNTLASYTNLPSGSYRFRVEAIQGTLVSAPATLEIRQQPFFWQRPPFVLALILTLFGLAWTAYRLHVRQIKARFQAVLGERGRLAREMHDTVIQGCTSISALLEAIASIRRTPLRHEEELLNYARAQIRVTIDEAREAVWNLRKPEEPDRSLPDILEALAVHAKREFSVPVDCRWEGETMLLGAPAAYEVSMTVREALCNAALHGRPKRIELSTEISAAGVRISIVDDGIGFLVEEQPGHFGITGMRERAARLGGQLHVESAPGAGTVIALCVSREALGRKSGWQ